MTDAETEILRQFFGAYFNQDWSLDASGPDDVIRQFIEDTGSASQAAGMAELIGRFIAEASGTDLESRLFRDLGCFYMPSADGVEAADWLRHVSSLLDPSLKTR
jgi:hypothetical protein